MVYFLITVHVHKLLPNLVVSTGPVSLCQRQGAMSAVQLVLLSVVILTCLQTGVARDSNDSKLLLQ